MMCFKTNFEMLLAFAIISIFMNDIYVVNGIQVYMNENITASVGEDGIEIKCSYTKENVKTIFTVGLFVRNKTNHDEFFSIATFLPDKGTLINPSGEYLSDRITLTNITQESNEATMILNELKCTDQNQYRCKVVYLNTNNDADSEMSLPTTIIVTAKPQKPHISIDTSQQNHNIEKRSILPVEVINRNSIYQTTNVTDHDMSSIPLPREGDNLTFVCSGNVGRPPGNIMWQKIYMNENISFKYVNETNQTDPLPWKCSFNRTSYLTIQLFAEDFNARIICFVVSHDGNNETYVETAPLKFHFGVRHVSINTLPDKQIFDTTINNITLTCNGDGNPKPTYAWSKQKDINTILSTSNIYVIQNVIKNNSGTYICEVQNSYNSSSEEKYNASTSVEITIENKHDTIEHNTSEQHLTSWIGIGIGGFVSLAAFSALAMYKCRARRKKLQDGEATLKSISGHGAMDNPGYTSDSEASIDHNRKDCEHVMEARNYTQENNEKQENEENAIRNPANQTNNEAASYAYVTVNSDYHPEKETNIDSKEMLKPSTIDEKNKPSTIVSSEYAKENMDNMMKYQNDNTCDDSSDHYASPVQDVYDALHEKRHKTDKGEKFDRMFELKSLPENKNESIDRNKSIENQDKTILDSHPIHLEESRRGGYESVVIDGDKPVISSENNGYGHGDPQTIRQHNNEYMHNLKQEEKKMNKFPISNRTAEYAQVNEATKLKNKTKNNDTDQTTVGVNARTQEGINGKSEDSPPEITDHFDTPNKDTSNDETESLNKSSQIECNKTQAFANDGKEKGEVAIVSPFTGSSVKFEGDRQKEDTNAEIQQGIEDRSGQTVDNVQNFDTNNQKNQQTNGDPESSFKYNQTGSHTNQALESEEHQHVGSVSLDGIQDDGQLHQNSEQQSNNGYEIVQIEQNQ